ncbi:MAG: hypothetical protein IPO72_19955 [Saprospiraceae bacterium]|nr:hypothetical protein [Candidatus Vicinibacter affinis]
MCASKDHCQLHPAMHELQAQPTGPDCGPAITGLECWTTGPAFSKASCTVS